jgi:hypothetical protein
VSQLAGFAKSGDLAYFLREICGATYEHEVRLAPTADILNAYRSKRITWAQYEHAFLALMRSRSVPWVLDPSPYRNNKTVLLCSEAKPNRCHRRLAPACTTGSVLLA